MIVAYIGNFGPEYSTENDVRKAFEYLGHEVIQLQENDVHIADIVNAMAEADMLLITSTWDNALPLEFMLHLFKELALEGKPTATLHLDTFWGTSRGGRKWWLNPMFHTAYIFTADGDYEKEWKAFGKNHIWLPPAVRHDAVHFGEYQEKYATDVAFVGSNGEGYHEKEWPYRKELVSKLREICVRNGWSFRNPGGSEPKIERSDSLNNFYASAKVIVGDSLCLKKEDSKYWSDRVPETTGRGGFLIMPRIDYLEKIHGKIPQYRWHDWQDLESKIKHYLDNPEERKEIVEGTHFITETSNTYVNRAQTIIDVVLGDKDE